MTQIIGAGIQIFNGTGGGGGGGPVTAAANGLSIENRAGVLTVVWGGSVLDEPVAIDLLGNEISFIDSTAAASYTFAGSFFLIALTDGVSNSTFELQPQANQFSSGSNGTVGQSNVFTSQSATDAQAGFNLIDNASGNTKQTSASVLIPGIEVSDTVDNIGLIGDSLFPESDPNQYAQYGNINSDPTTKFLVDAVNGTGNIFSINTPTTGETQYFFNFAAFSDTFSAGAVTQINLDYTDRVGNPQTIQLVNTITGDPESIVYSFIAAPNTSVTLSYSVTDTGGGNTLTVSGQIEQQQNFT